MRIGDLKKLLSLMNPVRVSDGQGGNSSTYIEVAKIWAKVTPSQGGEELSSSGLQHVIQHRVVTRFSRLVNSKSRFVMNDIDENRKPKKRTLEVDSFTNLDESNEWLEIVCVETTE